MHDDLVKWASTDRPRANPPGGFYARKLARDKATPELVEGPTP